MKKLPILLLIFNRSDNALEALRSIRDYAPEHLYIAADGPRAGKPGEKEKCEQVRRVVCDAVDWKCEVHTRFRDENMGCALAVNDAVTWFFDSVDYGIVCEDDVVLHPDFYRLCEEFLPYYVNEERVMLISAQNAVPQPDKADQLVFTNGCFIWGWASWRRAWAKMDMTMAAWPSYPKWRLVRHFGLFYGLMMYHYWNGHYRNIKSSTSWATRWKFSCIAAEGLTLSANVNLSRNTGTNVNGAHYRAGDGDMYSHVPFGSVRWPVKPPKSLVYDRHRLILDRKEFFRVRLKTMKKRISIHEGLNIVRLKILTRLRKKYISQTGLRGYRSYWHLRHKKSNDAPDTSQFYLAAQPNVGAGIGHQLANWIAGLWFARMFGVKSAHIPFPQKRWEDFFGFGIGRPTVRELSHRGWKVRRLPIFHETEEKEVQLVKDIMSSYSGEKVVFVCEQDQFYRDQYGVMDELQQMFYAAPARKGQRLIYDPRNYNVAIHVRRGDIMSDPTNRSLTKRYLANDYFEKVLAQVVEHFSKTLSKPLHIYFFSQGKPEDYPEFSRFANLHWCLDMEAQESFLHMVYADVLITSKSSFSYKPALLNRGIKICPKDFWHGYPDRKDWIMVDNEGWWVLGDR